MADTLRKQIIRLAHENPELRGDLLPLVKPRVAGVTERDLEKAIRSLRKVTDELTEEIGYDPGETSTRDHKRWDRSNIEEWNLIDDLVGKIEQWEELSKKDWKDLYDYTDKRDFQDVKDFFLSEEIQTEREIPRVAHKKAGLGGGKRAEKFPGQNVFNRQHPYHRDLETISMQRRTLIGNGIEEIPGKRAGILARKGLIDIIESQWGKELELTRKGRRSLEESMDAWDLL